MIIDIKTHLIQEGVLQSVKDNWGKGLMAAGGIALAHANAFGPTAKDAVDRGGSALKRFVEKAGDWSKDSMTKLNSTYGTDANGDGTKTLGETKDSPLDPNSSAVENGQLKDIQGPEDQSTAVKVFNELKEKIPDFSRKTNDDANTTAQSTTHDTTHDTTPNATHDNLGDTMKDSDTLEFMKSYEA